MKKLLSLTLAGVFSVSMLGCRASGEIDGPDDDHDRVEDRRDGDSSMKKTTTYDADGDVVRQKTTVDKD